MRRLSPCLAAAGYSPARYIPLSSAPESAMGQRLTDIQAIQRLFANGENGGYWPADPAYLYEDSAGAIPASVGGVVGLQLSATAKTLTELSPNGGTFTATSTWIVTAGTVIANGVATSTSVSSGTQLLGAGNNGVVGRYYQVVLQVDSIAGQIRPVLFNNVISSSVIKSPGIYTFTVLAANTYCYMQSYFNSTTCVCSRFSVKELVGGVALQATTGNKPYLRRTPVSDKTWLDSNTETGALTATFASGLGSACTIAMVGAEGVTIAENQTVGTTYNIAPYNASQLVRYRGDILIINRALTPVEKALVTRCFNRGLPTISNGAIL